MIQVEPPPEQPELLTEEEQSFWTPWRIIYTIITILVIVAFLTLVMWPLIDALTRSAPPPPTLPPMPRV